MVFYKIGLVVEAEQFVVNYVLIFFCISAHV